MLRGIYSRKHASCKQIAVCQNFGVGLSKKCALLRRRKSLIINIDLFVEPSIRYRAEAEQSPCRGRAEPVKAGLDVKFYVCFDWSNTNLSNLHESFFKKTEKNRSLMKSMQFINENDRIH